MKRLLLLLSAALSAQTALDAPPIARVLAPDGRLTPILGLAANFVPGTPGPALLAYSFDGDIEWRLEPGRLLATRNGETASIPTEASKAVFRDAIAHLPESNESFRLDGSTLVPSDLPPANHIAGRTILWTGGQLHIVQPGQSEPETVDCPAQPTRLTAAAADWAHLEINDRPYLLRLTPGRAALFVLPLRRRP